MKLPAIPEQTGRSRAETVAAGGLNLSDERRDGDLSWCENLSARRWPYIATREERGRLEEYSGVTALTAWGKLVAVAGGRLLLDGRDVGAVAPGQKQFAVVNTRLVIWPDRKYLDMDAQTVKDLGAAVSGTGAVFAGSDAESTLTVSGWGDLTALFCAGDTVTVSGCAAKPENNRSAAVRGVEAGRLTFAANAFAAGTEPGRITVERRIPDLDFICESENRLWGCSNSTRSIYASALGDPTNFFSYNNLSTDSYALAVGSEGDFTGCCKLGSAVLFWKENTLHKLLGSFPAEYALYTYNIEGLRAGCHKSMQVLNETLYYQGLHGVYAYAGGTPGLVSGQFGERDMKGVCAGSDGERYYLSALEDGTPHLLVYDTRTGLWLREDGTRCVDFARIGPTLYLLTDGGQVWTARGGGALKGAWSAQFAPFYETVRGRKRYTRLLMRLELPKGSWLRAQTRLDGGPWQECGRAVGREHDTAALYLPIRRGDKFELRLSGEGPCAVLSVMREFTVGSER